MALVMGLAICEACDVMGVFYNATLSPIRWEWTTLGACCPACAMRFDTPPPDDTAWELDRSGAIWQSAFMCAAYDMRRARAGHSQFLSDCIQVAFKKRRDSPE